LSNMRTERNRPYEAGFSLLELMVAFAVAALLVGVATPVAIRLYESMQYRSAVGELNAAFATARYKAITSGKPVDVSLQPDSRSFAVDGKAYKSLSSQVTLTIVSAAELSPDQDTAVIRFYPDGSSSGGNVGIERVRGGGISLDIDWLMGRVVQRQLEK